MHLETWLEFREFLKEAWQQGLFDAVAEFKQHPCCTEICVHIEALCEIGSVLVGDCQDTGQDLFLGVVFLKRY